VRAAETTYLQGAGVTGEVTQAGREGQFEVLGFNHEVAQERDPATGLPTGKRQHAPFKVILRHSEGIVALATQLVNNSVIPSAVVNLWKPTAGGAEALYFKYTLTNLKVLSMRPWQPNKADRTAADYPHMVEVSFAYESIKWSNFSGSVEQTDTWTD
jgi:type VI secretion system secreted protein Hcp